MLCCIEGEAEGWVVGQTREAGGVFVDMDFQRIRFIREAKGLSACSPKGRQYSPCAKRAGKSQWTKSKRQNPNGQTPNGQTPNPNEQLMLRSRQIS
jgi:hypothetical protein